MKKITLILFTCISAFTAKAQFFQKIQYGVMGGVNIAYLKETEGLPFTFGRKVDYHYGGFANIPIAEGFSLEPEIMYSREGGKFVAGDEKIYFNFNCLYFPVLLKYTHKSGFFVEAGPQFGNITSAFLKGEGQNVPFYNFIEHPNFNWAFGIGYKLPYSFGVNLRYNVAVDNLAKNSSTEDTAIGILKTRDLQAGISYDLSHFFKYKRK